MVGGARVWGACMTQMKFDEVEVHIQISYSTLNGAEVTFRCLCRCQNVTAATFKVEQNILMKSCLLRMQYVFFCEIKT